MDSWCTVYSGCPVKQGAPRNLNKEEMDGGEGNPKKEVGQGVCMVNVSLKVYWSRERYSVLLFTLP